MSKTKKEVEEKEETPVSAIQSISKATYNKQGVNVEFHTAKIIDGKGKLKKESVEDPTPPHPDLILSLRILLPHFLKMTPFASLFPEIDEKFIKGRKVLDFKSDDKTNPINIFQVNGVSFSGDEDSADYQVQLIGRAIYPNGKVISMTLPGERLNAEGGYAFKEQLAEDINSFIDEIDKFVNEGKALQGSLQLEPANGNDER